MASAGACGWIPASSGSSTSVSGRRNRIPSRQCGDVLVRDRLGNWTYQFAVTVDDHLQKITDVIRGVDLLDSTGRQLRLAKLLGRATPPRFRHHPLVMKSPTQKLSKSDGDTRRCATCGRRAGPPSRCSKKPAPSDTLRPMKRVLFAVLAAALLAPAVPLAHPGHDHKLMGTITSIDKNKVVVKTTEGKDMTFEITPLTTFKRGKEKGAASDLKAGLRVVVNIGDGVEPLKAKDVQYTATTTTTAKQ